MKIAIIGTGRMGKGLAKTFAESMNDVIWASRSYETVKHLAAQLGGNVQPAAIADALSSDILIPTLWFQDLLPWLEAHQAELQGKILVDITNPFNANFDELTTAWGTSAAEAVQRSVPDTIVIGAFKNTFWKVFEQPLQAGMASDVFVTGDHEQAKNTVLQVFDQLPFRFLDAGSIVNNRVIERMTLFSRELALRYNHYPHVSWKLWGGYEAQPMQTKGQITDERDSF